MTAPKEERDAESDLFLPDAHLFPPSLNAGAHDEYCSGESMVLVKPQYLNQWCWIDEPVRSQ